MTTTDPSSTARPAAPLLPADAWLRPGVITTVTDDGMTLINVAGAIFTTTTSGRVAVEALRAGSAAGRVAAAVEALRERYQLDAATAQADLAVLLDQLDAAKLVRIRRP